MVKTVSSGEFLARHRQACRTARFGDSNVVQGAADFHGDFREVDWRCLAVLFVSPIVGDKMGSGALQSKLRKVCRNGPLGVVELEVVILPNVIKNRDLCRSSAHAGVSRWGSRASVGNIRWDVSQWLRRLSLGETGRLDGTRRRTW